MNMGHNGAQKLTVKQVVVTKEHNPVPSGFVEKIIEFAAQSKRRGIFKIAYFFRMKGVGNFFDFIVRRVVADDHFEMRVGLVQTALKSISNVFRSFISRDTDGNKEFAFFWHDQEYTLGGLPCKQRGPFYFGYNVVYSLNVSIFDGLFFH